jgi:predicted ribosome quality control (RQC) complex YloA/Tae2 family protein
MEANFCRFLFADLAARLGGARIDKIFNPAPEVWTFTLSTPGRGIFLLFRADKKAPLLFTSETKPDNPKAPSAACMWFRKRLSGAALAGAVWDWPGRVMAWQIGTSRPEVHGKFLTFDLAGGLRLEEEPPPGSSREPEWPSLDDVLADSGLWRRYPQITPPLRRALSAMPRGEAEGVYAEAAFGGTGTFHLYTGKGQATVLPWRLPEAMASDREEKVCTSALEAAAELGREVLFSDLAQAGRAPDQERLKAAERRLLKNIANVDRDEKRLQGMIEEGRQGEIVKSVLHEHGPEERLEEVEGFAPDGGRERVRLDPTVSVAKNMERFFKRSAKGRRGLVHVAERRKVLEAQLAELRAGKAPAVDFKPPRARAKARQGGGGYKGLAVNVYVTDDGFTLLRGKNQKANHELLSKAASQHDLWFHARGVSGSHVVLKRDHPGLQVPEQSLRQAAIIAGLYSGYGTADTAEVICALVRDVRKIKGAALGRVAVDQEFASLRVTPDPELAERLKR